MSCGAPVTPAPGPAREARKVITVLFSDVTGFTSISERLDTEALHAVMEHYFAAMRRLVERHGGRVERFIGDAVMAVFGLPVTHEDDALRALRAAADIPRALEEVNSLLPGGLSVTLSASTGVNTGEVFISDAEASGAASGELLADAVNVAARLEGAAAPGEVLMGEQTYQLARAAVRAERLELPLKGKSDPVTAYRMSSLASPGRSFRTLSARTVGREYEERALLAAFADAVVRGRCVLATVIGDPGTGKSRLARDTVAALADRALRLGGRCLPYGEATVYWPLAEIACQAAGIRHDEHPDTAVEAIARLLREEPGERDRATAARLAGAFGLAPLVGGADDIARDTVELFSALARSGPLVAVVEDIHWAKTGLLDTIEHLARHLHDVPVLLLCTARRELSDLRPGWADGAPSGLTVELGALTEADTAGLVAELLGGADVAGELVAPVSTISAGNPLFVEEVLAMLVDEGKLVGGAEGWRLTQPVRELELPPTIGAVLAARLDRLAADERELIECAAIVGKDFDEEDVNAVSDTSSRAVAELLNGLCERQLISLGADVATDYRFHHILVRDAVYSATPKRRRAALHERFADYLERSPGARSEGTFGEIAGEHLERACLLRRELGTPDADLESLSHRAGSLLAQAGWRARGLSDFAAAARIYTRGEAVLTPGDHLRAELLTGVAEAKFDLGLPGQATESAELAIELLTPAHDEGLRSRATLERLKGEVWCGRRKIGEVLDEMRTYALDLERSGQHRLATRAWNSVGGVCLMAGRFADSQDACERAVALARDHAPDQLGYNLVPLAAAVSRGPVPAAEGLPLLEAALAEVQADTLHAAMIEDHIASAEAMCGRMDGARARFDRAIAACARHGSSLFTYLYEIDWGAFELLVGDAVAAERLLRKGRDDAAHLDPAFAGSAAAYHARGLAVLGDHAAAAAQAMRAAPDVSSNDVEGQAWWRIAAALGLAGTRSVAEAEKLARQAVVIARETDSLLLIGDALRCLGGIRLAAGEPDGRVLLAEAADAYESKGVRLAAERVRDSLAAAVVGPPV